MSEEKQKTKAQKILEALATGPKTIGELHKALGGREEGKRPLGSTYGTLREMRLMGLIVKAPVMFEIKKEVGK
jgi:hypothetical protein